MNKLIGIIFSCSIFAGVVTLGLARHAKYETDDRVILAFAVAGTVFMGLVTICKAIEIHAQSPK
jgi:hypothetical protein